LSKTPLSSKTPNPWPEALLRAWQLADSVPEADPEWLTRGLSLPLAVAEHLSLVYTPLARRLTQLLPGWQTPPVLGINGAQGTGKSTAAALLAALLEREGFKVCCLSIDDLYLSRQERTRLAAEQHPLLQTRGVPGTHDLRLGLDLLDRLQEADDTTRLGIPRFDKAADDRKPEPDWDLWQGRPDLILFEGWCLGARPEPPSALAQPVNQLERRQDPEAVWRGFVNRQLADYQSLFRRLDFLVMLKAPSFDQVYTWRAEQEEALKARLRAQGLPVQRAMSEEQLRHFIEHYERLTRWILQDLPGRSDLVLSLNPKHRVESIHAQPGSRL